MKLSKVMCPGSEVATAIKCSAEKEMGEILLADVGSYRVQSEPGHYSSRHKFCNGSSSVDYGNEKLFSLTQVFCFERWSCKLLFSFL